jgi:hypothetical protein
VSYAIEPVDLNELITRALGMARPRARTKEVQLALRESPEEVTERILEWGSLRARLLQDPTQPVDPGPGEVAHDRPDWPAVSRCPQLKLFSPQFWDSIGQMRLDSLPALKDRRHAHADGSAMRRLMAAARSSSSTGFTR